MEGSRRRAGQRGQVLPLFALSIFVLTAMVALVVDVSWWWSNALKVQRAADAAALAGAIYLPGNPAGAYAVARAEATKNGYTDGAAGVTVTAVQDSQNVRRLTVTISSPVGTYFARVAGLDQVTVTRTARAEYTQPLPMGSPQNYYGVSVLRSPLDLLFGPRPITSSDGATTLASQGFWGTIGAQGMDKVNGDAFAAKWDPRTSAVNSEYQPTAYYDYVVELAPNSRNVGIYVFDAPFCATAGSGEYGTGDRFLGSPNPISTFYELYDTGGTLSDFSDDRLLASSGNLFRRNFGTDVLLLGPPVLSVPGILECTAGITLDPLDFRYWHNAWWPLATGLSAGAGGAYARVHVSTTDRTAPNDQNNADGHNSFAIEARVTSGSYAAPRVYGLGTMEAFSSIRGGGASEFYLAQVASHYAGKTLQIELFDAGDVGSLTGSLQVLQPTASGYAPATFSYSATQAAASGAACSARAGTGVTSVTTASGGTNYFNGCWLTITVALPTNYSAPTPPGVPGPGWWKIRYTMSGSSSDNAYDITVWKATIRGSPVHLVTP